MSPCTCSFHGLFFTHLWFYTLLAWLRFHLLHCLPLFLLQAENNRQVLLNFCFFLLYFILPFVPLETSLLGYYQDLLILLLFCGEHASKTRERTKSLAACRYNVNNQQHISHSTPPLKSLWLPVVPNMRSLSRGDIKCLMKKQSSVPTFLLLGENN